MISEDKSSLESKVILAIKTVFEDLTERMVNSTLETDFSRQTTSLHYIFKKDGSFEIIDFIGGCSCNDFYEYYSAQFNNDDFDFSIKICDYLYLLIVKFLKTNDSKVKTTKDLENAMKEICFKILTQVDNKIYFLPPVQYFYSNGNNVTVLTSEELKKFY
jgi:hypothetical protein